MFRDKSKPRQVKLHDTHTHTHTLSHCKHEYKLPLCSVLALNHTLPSLLALSYPQFLTHQTLLSCTLPSEAHGAKLLAPF